MQVFRNIGVRAAAGRMAARTRSPFDGVQLRNSLRRAKRRTRAAVDRAITTIKHDRRAQAKVAGVALALVTAGLVARARMKH
ncbi:MAG TPA: hypothetical protein VGA78_00440 [Gemmatimonadales bacterium]